RAGRPPLCGLVPQLLGQVPWSRRGRDAGGSHAAHGVLARRLSLSLSRAAQRVKLEIVTICTELLLGYTVDSNAAELGRALAAAGWWIGGARGRVAVLLPGVPREMRGLLVEEVLPRLVHHEAPGARPRVVLSRTVRTTGVPESALAERLGSIEGEIAPLTLAYL